jgi:hypothetical protein
MDHPGLAVGAAKALAMKATSVTIEYSILTFEECYCEEKGILRTDRRCESRDDEAVDELV